MHLTYVGTSLSSQIRSYLLRSGSDQPPVGQSVSALRVRSVDGAKLGSSAVRAVRGRYYRSLQNRAGSEPGACQNSGTVEAVWIGTASGEDESGLLQGYQSGRASPEREVSCIAVRGSPSKILPGRSIPNFGDGSTTMGALRLRRSGPSRGMSANRWFAGLVGNIRSYAITGVEHGLG